MRGSPHRSSFSGPAHPVPGGHCPLARTPWPLPCHMYSRLLLQRPAVIASDPKPSWPKIAQVCCLPAPVGLESRCGHSPCFEALSRAAVSRERLDQGGIGVVNPGTGWGASHSFAHVGPSTGGRQGLRSSRRVLLPAGREGVPHKVGRGPEPAQRPSSPESLSPPHLAWMTLPGPHPTLAGRAAKGPAVTRVLPLLLRPQPAWGPLATGSSQPTAERLCRGEADSPALRASSKGSVGGHRVCVGAGVWRPEAHRGR